MSVILADPDPWSLFRLEQVDGINGDEVATYPGFPDTADWTGDGAGSPSDGTWNVRLDPTFWPMGHRDRLRTPDGTVLVVTTAKLVPQNGDVRFDPVAHVRVEASQVEFTPYPRSS